MPVRLSALHTGRPLHTGKFLVLISVTRGVVPRDVLRLEGLGQSKNPTTEPSPRSSSLQHSASTKLLHTSWYSYVGVIKSGMLKKAMTKIQTHYLQFLIIQQTWDFLARLQICTNYFPICVLAGRSTLYSEISGIPSLNIQSPSSWTIQSLWDQQNRVQLLLAVWATQFYLWILEIESFNQCSWIIHSKHLWYT
jgi:hypothetical protein